MNRGRGKVVQADALEFELPNDPIVLFLYNPFSCEVMREFVAGVEASFSSSPRRIVVVYLKAECAQLWDELSLLTRLNTSNASAVWDTSLAAVEPAD